jgi:hypothetical protein
MIGCIAKWTVVNPICEVECAKALPHIDADIFCSARCASWCASEHQLKDKCGLHALKLFDLRLIVTIKRLAGPVYGYFFGAGRAAGLRLFPGRNANAPICFCNEGGRTVPLLVLLHQKKNLLADRTFCGLTFFFGRQAVFRRKKTAVGPVCEN